MSQKSEDSSTAGSTLDLVRRAQQGDRAALDQLYGRYLPRLTRWASGRLPARARGAFDTEDLVQDAMARTFRRLPELDPQGGGFFQAYTRNAVLNAIRNKVRDAKDNVPISAVGSVGDQAPSPLEQLIGRETLDRYEQSLERLSGEERAAVIARLELRMSWQEIAEDLGKASPDAARMIVKRALLRIAQEMSG